MESSHFTRAINLYKSSKTIRNSGTGQMCSILSTLQLAANCKTEPEGLVSLARTMKNAFDQVNNYGSTIADSVKIGGQPPSGDRLTLFANLFDTRIIILDDVGNIWAIEPEDERDQRLDLFLALLPGHQKQALDNICERRSRIPRHMILPFVIKWSRNVHFEAMDFTDRDSIVSAITLFVEQDERRTHKLYRCKMEEEQSEAAYKESRAAAIDSIPVVKIHVFSTPDDDDDLSRAVAMSLEIEPRLNTTVKIKVPSNTHVDVEIQRAIDENNKIEAKKQKEREIESDRIFAESLQEEYQVPNVFRNKKEKEKKCKKINRSQHDDDIVERLREIERTLGRIQKKKVGKK